MFSNDINTRDLYFSNPVDHFLGQDQEVKTSFESGFSSSQNQTGNSKELQYRSSQELFSQTRSQDLFSQNDRTNSQFEARNLDYQRYISENLLLGKDSPRGILSFNAKEKVTRKEKQMSPLAPKEFDENHIKEIKTSLETLNDSVKKLNSEMGIRHNNLQEELSRLNERISFVERAVGQKFELIADNYKNFANTIKKEEKDKKQLHEKMFEAAESVKNLENKIEDFGEQNKVIQDNIKKISKNYEEKHKKQLQKLQDQYSSIDKALRKRNSIVESSVENIQESFENSLDQKFESIKNYLENTLSQLVQSNGAQNTSTLINKQISPKGICDLLENDFEITKYKKPMTFSNYSSSHNYQNSNTGRSKTSEQLLHTPLSHFLNKYEHNVEPAQNYKLRSSNRPELSSYKDTNSYSSLRIKRKNTTPLRKVISPKFKKPMFNARNSQCTPLISKFKSDGTCNETFFHRNETVFPKKQIWRHNDQ